MNNFTDLSLINELQCNNKDAYEILYMRYFSVIASYIKQNRGNDEDAQDVFQEAIIVLFEKVKHPDFVLTSSLSTYLFAISKNIWLKHLRNHKFVVTDQLDETLHNAELLVHGEEDVDLFEKVDSWLNKITKHCQQVLRALFFYNQSIETLMGIMGWKNRHTADNQKYKCIQQLKKNSKRE